MTQTNEAVYRKNYKHVLICLLSVWIVSYNLKISIKFVVPLDSLHKKCEVLNSSPYFPLFCFSVAVIYLQIWRKINTSHFLCWESKEKRIPSRMRFSAYEKTFLFIFIYLPRINYMVRMLPCVNMCK